MSRAQTLGFRPRQVIAQVSVCDGPTCGGSRTPEGQRSAIAPIDRLRLVTAWKENRLYPSVHLCFTGCLGCCAYAPVIAIAHAEGACLRGEGTASEVEVDLVAWAQAIAKRQSWVQPKFSSDSIDLQRFAQTPSGRGERFIE